MWTAREYAPIDNRKTTDLPDSQELKEWNTEAATWLTAQMLQKFRQSRFAEFADFDAKMFEAWAQEALSEATYEVLKVLED